VGSNPTVPTVKWHKNDALFEEQLKRGHKWQCHVAGLVSDMGYDVDVPEYSMRASIADAHEYADEHDLLVNGHVVEVKSRNLSFAGPHDYPYPTLFIDTQRGFDAKRRTPVAVLCVSQKTGQVCALDVAKTRSEWTVCRVWDSVRKIHITNYQCGREHWEGLAEVMSRVILDNPPE
jgi:hypothetical protein